MEHSAKILKYETQPLKIETGDRDSSKHLKKPLISKHFNCSLFDKEQVKILINASLSCHSLNTDTTEYSRHLDDGDEFSQHPCDLIVSGKTTCSTCVVNFTTRKQQVDHCKMGWHRFNLKEKMKGNSPLSETEYNQLLVDRLDLLRSESDDEDKSAFPVYNKISDVRFSETSTTNSDDDEEDENINRLKLQPKIYFETESEKAIGIYRCVIYPKKEALAGEENLSDVLSKISEESIWAIILIGGGYFAAAVYEKNNVVLHKTFHRYTVRAKQGGNQSVRDGKQNGHKAKSAGSALRRHNEAALIKEIQELLNSWAPKLSLCHRIFYRAPSHNRTVLFGGKNPPFNRKDERLRTIPFPTARATLDEVQKVHKLLSTLECFDREKEDLKSMFIEAHEKPNCESNEMPNDKVSSEVITIPALELNTFSLVSGNSQDCELEKCKKQESNIQSVIDFSLLSRGYSSSCMPENMNCTEIDTQNDLLFKNLQKKPSMQQKEFSFSVLKEDKGQSGLNTLESSVKSKKNREVSLAAASKENNLHINDCPEKINTNLSERYVKSPVLIRKESSDKEIESCLVLNIANKDSLSNKNATQLANTVTESVASEKSAKNVEKCKEKKKAKKARFKERKALAAKQKAEEEETQKFLALNDREKISINAGLPLKVKFQVFSRCFQCGLDISGKTPFEYLSFKFCNMSCLKEHKMHRKK